MKLSPLTQAIFVGGAAAGVLDAIDALVAFRLVLGFDPIPIYQFVASGVLGAEAFSGGLPVALFGLAIHFLIAFSAAAVYALASTRVPVLRARVWAGGASFGVAVWAVMNLVVIPLSRIPAAPFSWPLFLNGVVGHALFVGMPIALATRLFLGAPKRSTALHAQAAE